MSYEMSNSYIEEFSNKRNVNSNVERIIIECNKIIQTYKH